MLYRFAAHGTAAALARLGRPGHRVAARRRGHRHRQLPHRCGRTPTGASPRSCRSSSRSPCSASSCRCSSRRTWSTAPSSPATAPSACSRRWASPRGRSSPCTSSRCWLRRSSAASAASCSESRWPRRCSPRPIAPTTCRRRSAAYPSGSWSRCSSARPILVTAAAVGPAHPGRPSGRERGDQHRPGTPRRPRLPAATGAHRDPVAAGAGDRAGHAAGPAGPRRRHRRGHHAGRGHAGLRGRPDQLTDRHPRRVHPGRRRCRSRSHARRAQIRVPKPGTSAAAVHPTGPGRVASHHRGRTRHRARRLGSRRHRAHRRASIRTSPSRRTTVTPAGPASR